MAVVHNWQGTHLPVLCLIYTSFHKHWQMLLSSLRVLDNSQQMKVLITGGSNNDLSAVAIICNSGTCLKHMPRSQYQTLAAVILLKLLLNNMSKWGISWKRRKSQSFLFYLQPKIMCLSQNVVLHIGKRNVQVESRLELFGATYSSVLTFKIKNLLQFCF